MTDEPFKWWLGIPLTNSATVNMHPEGIDPGANTLTLQKLRDAASKLPEPHPLSGLDIIHYAPNMRDAARAFVEEYNKPPRMGWLLRAQESDLLPPGHIIGLRGAEVVMLVGQPKDHDTPNPVQ